MTLIHRPTCLLVLALALGGISGCGEQPPPPAEITPRVKYFVVGEQATGQARRISGKLVAAESSRLSFGVSGTVAEVLVNRGDTVKEGQILASLDTEPLQLALDQARAQVNISRAKVEETRQIYERSSKLFEKRAVSKADVDAATANHSTARGNLRAAQSDLKRKQRDLSLAELSSPFAGTIATREIEAFQEITTGQEAFVLESAGALEVEVRVPETFIRDVDYGQVVQVSFPTLSDTQVTGAVNEIGSRTEVGNAFPVNIQLPGVNDLLLPGMTASVTFNFDAYLEGQTVYLIPLSALAIEFGTIRNSGEAPADNRHNVPVFIVDQAGKLQARDIVVGDLRGNMLEVFQGLEAGDKVVSAGVTFLRENMTVELWTAEQGLSGG